LFPSAGTGRGPAGAVLAGVDLVVVINEVVVVVVVVARLVRLVVVVAAVSGVDDRVELAAG
jgi:hypothetical protein